MARTTQRYTDDERKVALDYGRRKLAELQAEGVARVQIMSSGDANVCNACKKLDGKVFLVGEVPILPVHEETDETWYICRCIYTPADDLRLSRRALPRISVTGLESLGLLGNALANTKRRIVERLRELKCPEHHAVPMSVQLESLEGNRAKLTVASCCPALHEPSGAIVASVLQSRSR